MSDTNVIKLPTTPKASEKDLEKKWGKKVVAHGFTIFPSILIQAQRRLGLTPVQMNVLLQLLDHWWTYDNKPFPSKTTIADRIGFTPRYIQMVMKELEDVGYVKRVRRTTRFGDPDTNIYDLSGLTQKLKALEPEFAKAKEEKRRIQQTVETPKGRRRR